MTSNERSGKGADDKDTDLHEDDPDGGGNLKRRPDNVGQSGRWRSEDEKSRYGREEGTHPTEQSSDGSSGVVPQTSRKMPKPD